MIQHNKKPKPSKGKKICPNCCLESGTRTQGRCKGTTADGTACTHDWGRTIPKKDRLIAKLKAELDDCRASSGHGGSSSSSGGAASAQIINLRDEITRLENKNVQLMTENNRLRQDALHGDNFLDNLDSGLDDPLPSLSRENSLKPVSPRGAAPSLGGRENSLDELPGWGALGGSPPSSRHSAGSSSLDEATKATADAEWASVLHLLEKNEDGESKGDGALQQENVQLKQENAQLKQQLDGVRQTLQLLLQKIN